MSNRLSHSAVSKLLDCGQMFKYHYKDKIKPRGISSALLFGTAIDDAIGVSLEGGNGDQAFIDKWTTQDIKGKPTNVESYSHLSYFKSDYDLDLLEPEDFDFLEQIRPNSVDGIQEAAKAIKQEAFVPVKEEVYTYYNRACWLSLKRKGLLLVEAFNRDIKPRITKVLAVQKKVDLVNEDGDEAVGYLDLIAELDTGDVVVIDIKTASRPYDEDSVKTSPQLALYSYAVADEHPHQLSAFAVLLKKIKKDQTKTCTVCGTENTSSHKKCPAMEGGNRCNGEFTYVKDYYAQTQFIIDEISDTMKVATISNFNMANKAVKAEIYLKNFSKCLDYYGKRCAYYDLCYNESMEGLDKEKEAE